MTQEEKELLLNEMIINNEKLNVMIEMACKDDRLISRETWWRHYYKRVTIDAITAWGGRCLVCDAANPSNKSIRCDIMNDRYCPCEYNQCLKYK